MKTYQEFISEAKKCWPGYKKKGTQKLFGKTYNRCVKEDKIDEAKSDSDLSKDQKVAVRNKRRGMNTVDRMMVHWDDRGEKKQRGEKESDWWKTKFVKDKSGKLSKYRDWHVTNQGDKRAKIEVEESWSEKYKKSIDCNNPKGFSQRAHCQGKKKKK